MKPSERFKKRYVSFALSADGAAPAYSEAKSIVHEHFLSMFGEFGISSLAFKLIKYDQKTGKGMLRCERSRLEEAVFCMACLSVWNGKKCRLEPLSAGGSVKRT